MQTISVTSPTLPNGTGKIAARLLKAGYTSRGEQYFLSPADQHAGDISASELRLLKLNPIMSLAEPTSLLEGLIQDREGNVVFSLAFDLVP
jgi:hypothetical protein